MSDLHEVQSPHWLSPVRRFDELADQALDRFRGREPHDRIAYALSELADFSLLWHLIGWSRALRDPDELAAAVRLSVCLGIDSVFVNGFVKMLFRRERPVQESDRPHRLRVPITTSFPSGHASSATVAAVLLSDGRRPNPLLWGLAGAVAASRAHVRIHHASDVFGGVALGLVMGSIMRRVWPVKPHGRGRSRRRGR